MFDNLAVWTYVIWLSHKAVAWRSSPDYHGRQESQRKELVLYKLPQR